MFSSKWAKSFGKKRMTRLRSGTYHFRHALRNIFSNSLIHAVSMGTITISVLLIGAFMLFYVNVSSWVVQWGQSLSMSVYLVDDIDEVTKGGIEAVLKELPHATIQDFVSKEKAMMEMRDALGVQAGLLDGLTVNPFPASFEIMFDSKGRDETAPQKLKERLEEIEGIAEVQYSEQWVERFEGVIDMLKLAGLIIGGLLCIAVLFIVTNTIKLTIYSRQDEIEIMKIVGATDGFVKMPYLMEGGLQGLVGGCIALLILFSLYLLFSLRTEGILGLPVMNIVFLKGAHVGLILILSLFLGLTGSFIALGRFFRS